jgi:CheY-like chemotaxis protein/MinD-like ATPase involved in chromosome partitioning or flagellar assembly
MAEVLLIVDDDVDTLRLVGLMLQRQGYTILTANNGQQAINMVVEEQPDLILLDVMMPGMDGYEVTRHLRGDPNTADIPIIMFTAKTQLDDKVTGFEAGADDYLTKPTQPRELFAHVKAVLARSMKSRKITKTPAIEGVEKGKVIGVLAAKGGLGVSTMVTNLGIALYKKTQQSTIVAEFRPGQGNIGLNLGYVRFETINNLLELTVSELSPRDIKNCLVSHNSGIKLLLASYQPKDARYITFSETFETIIRNLATMAKYVILDLGPSLPPITEQTLSHCDELLIIIEPIPVTITQTRELLTELNARGFEQEQTKVILVNRTEADYLMTPTQIQEQLGANIDLVCTPATEILYQASANHTPVVINQPESPITQQFNKIADLFT